MITCYDCNTKILNDDDWCNECDTCNRCCYCRKDIVNEFNSGLHFLSAKKNEYKINPLNRFISAEIEVAKINKSARSIEALIKKWKGSVVHDGSLPNSGFEINTAPASGDIFVKQIKEICSVIKSAGGAVNKSCGLHVHLDARDFNFHDIKRLVKIYDVIEPVLFNLVPANRRNSRFCKKCANAYKKILDKSNTYENVKSSVVSGVYPVSHSTAYRKTKYNDARYNALNLHSWFYRGTIEYRLFNGTIDPKDIINWGMMWAYILDYALHSTNKEIDKLLEKNSPMNSLIKIVDNKNVIAFIKQRYKKYGE